MAAELIGFVQVYLWIGAAVAAVFLTIGIGRIDKNARGVWVFRPLLVPGILLIWPVVLLRWWQLARGGADAQGRYRPPLGVQPLAALVLAVAVPVIIASALVIRQDGPLEAPAELLEPPR